MKITKFPSFDEAIYLHDKLLERFGGAKGIRDRGLLESALYRPRTGYYGSLSLQAAALLQSLAQNHPFIDGNKRVAFAMTAVFLKTNGYKLIVSADDGETFMIKELIGKKIAIEQIAEWLEKHMHSV